MKAIEKKEYIIEQYALSFNDNNKANFELNVLPSSTDTALSNLTCRKIYIVQLSNGDYWYVGEAHTSIKKRFQRGFTSYRYALRNDGKGRNGYAGYKWIKPGMELRASTTAKVHVITFLDETIHREFVEAIEGELAFHIRKETGDWPRYQNEIHFYSSREELVEGAEELAREIWGEL